MFQESMHPAAQALTVSQVTAQIKQVLEGRFPMLTVVGEIANFKRAASGHWYFSLKDEQSQIRCNMWRSMTRRVEFSPTDGMEVMVAGGVNVYPPRGEYNLIVERMEEMGLGRLRAEFERLKAKLREGGLFDPAHKKPLPLLPRKIGVVTSATGAALRDILRVLRKRFAGLHVLVYPARVQGEGAAAEIAAGIAYLDRLGECDAIIAGRGGGSELDLWPFNEEAVARAIFAADTPIISAVGHEVDFTIADFVADVRAATPSHAAELVVKSWAEYRQTVAYHLKALDRAMQRKLLQLKSRVNLSESHPIFIKVRSRVNDCQRRLAELEYRSRTRVTECLRRGELRLVRALEQVDAGKLRNRIERCAHRLTVAADALDRELESGMEKAGRHLALLANRLEDLSPLKVLGRGYAVVYHRDDKVVRRPGDVRFGEIVRIQLAEGDLRARVLEPVAEAVQPELF